MLTALAKVGTVIGAMGEVVSIVGISDGTSVRVGARAWGGSRVSGVLVLIGRVASSFVGVIN